MFVPGVSPVSPVLTITWVDRRGREEPIPAPERSYFTLRLSPDGTKIVTETAVGGEQRSLWVFDLARQTMTPLTLQPGRYAAPVWTPDGRRILFASNHGTILDNQVFAQAADGTGVAEPLTNSANSMSPSSVSPDGTRVVIHEITLNDRDSNLALLTLGPKRRVEPLLQTQFRESDGEISPDGRWLAYQSNDSGQDQIYVRPFPNVNDGRWPISPAGGSRPVWSPAGRELFYVTGSNGALSVMAVPIQTAPTFSAGRGHKTIRRSLFSWARSLRSRVRRLA